MCGVQFQLVCLEFPLYLILSIPAVLSFLDIRNLASFQLLWSTTVFLIVCFMKKKWSYVHMLTWTLIPQLLMSHLFLTLGTLIAERTMYLSSIGICLIFGHTFYYIFAEWEWRNLATKTLQVALFLGIVTWFLPLCHRRSIEWKTDESLFLSGAQVCSNSAKLHGQLVTLYQNKVYLSVNVFFSLVLPRLESQSYFRTI